MVDLHEEEKGCEHQLSHPVIVCINPGSVEPTRDFEKNSSRQNEQRKITTSVPVFSAMLS